MDKPFSKQYTIAIDTVPLPESPEKRVQIALDAISPVINQILRDAMNIAVGSWPTPDRPTE